MKHSPAGGSDSPKTERPIVTGVDRLLRKPLSLGLSACLRRGWIPAGRWRVEPVAVRSVRRCGAALGERTARTRYGFEMRLDLTDWVDQHIFATGDYEPMTGRAIDALLGSGQCAVDVGANVGYFSLLMSRRVGERGTVLAFEPVPGTRRRLEQNVALNSDSQVEVRAEAVGASVAEVELHLGTATHSGVASLRPIDGSEGALRVPQTTLDAALGDRRPTLLKIDVEGAEAGVLDGAEDLLERASPDLVLEVSAQFLPEFGETGRSLCDRLLSRGYAMYRIDWDGLAPVSKEAVAVWPDSFPAQFNALFTKRPVPPSSLPMKTADGGRPYRKGQVPSHRPNGGRDRQLDSGPSGQDPQPNERMR